MGAVEWTLQQIEEYFIAKKARLEELYAKSSLPWGPKDGPEEKAKSLLLECLEMHFGSLRDCVSLEEDVMMAIRQIGEICYAVTAKYEAPMKHD